MYYGICVGSGKYIKRIKGMKKRCLCFSMILCYNNFMATLWQQFIRKPMEIM